MSLQFETTKIENGITIVRLIGDLVAGSEGQALEQLVRDLVGRGERRLIMDLCGIEKITDAGAQFLIQCYFTMRQSEGEIRLASANPKVASLISVTRLDTLLPYYRTVKAASANFELKKGA